MGETPGYTSKDFIEEHIPYRLELLDTYCTAILLGRFKQYPGMKMGSEFIVPTNYGFMVSPMTQLFNLAFESGIITFRLLMEFIGIKPDKDATKLAIATGREDDFHISKICDVNGVALLPVDLPTLNMLKDIQCSLFDNSTKLSVPKKFSEMHQQANTAAAHLVQRERTYHRLPNYFACLALRSLIKVLVYERLEEEKILENRGAWSNTMLHPGVFAEHARASGEMDMLIREQFGASSLTPNAT